MTHPTALILTALATGYRYGFDIMDVTGLPSGTVYPALRRLQDARLVSSTWESEREARDDRRPRRRLYELTSEGRRTLAGAEARLRDARLLLGGPLRGDLA
jgi:DNA-binding PadR family transcriptional regulator